MDTSKFFTVLCAILLLICLCLTLATVAVLRFTLNKAQGMQESAAVLSDVILSQSPDTAPEEESAPPLPDEDVAADILYGSFVLKERNGEIGVYGEDGRLIRTFAVRVSTLPREAREALRRGVTFHSWRELMALIEDYSS